MQILVTGATGFIGGHLARRLTILGHTVRVLVRHPTPELEARGLDVRPGDLIRPETLAPAVEGVQAVFHLAAVRDHWDTPPETYEAVNVDGTRYLLQAAAEAGAARFIYCSSVGVARYPGRIDADESLPYSEPTSQVAYHRTKAQAERLVLDAAGRGESAALVVRPVITYGPEDATGMVTRLLTMLARRRFLPVGNGRNHVDLAYIDDIVNGMIQALVRGRSGQIYILSSPRPATMREVLSAASEALNVPVPAIYLPAGPARLAAGGCEALFGALHRQPPLTRGAVATLTVDRGFSHAWAAQELGYAPEVDLTAGFARTAAWLRETGRIPERC